MTSTSASTLLASFGPLRWALIAVVMVNILLRPTPGDMVEVEGWYVVTHLLAPVFSPILFMLLLLDTLMGLVYRSDKQGTLRTHYTVIVLVNFCLAIFFLFYWIPYFKALNF